MFPARLENLYLTRSYKMFHEQIVELPCQFRECRLSYKNWIDIAYYVKLYFYFHIFYSYQLNVLLWLSSIDCHSDEHIKQFCNFLVLKKRRVTLATY